MIRFRTRFGRDAAASFAHADTRWYFRSILFFSLLCFAGVVPAVAATGSVVTVGFRPGDVRWEVGEGGVRPRLPGTVPVAEPGAWDLPVAILPVTPPPGTRLDAVEILDAAWAPLDAPGAPARFAPDRVEPGTPPRNPFADAAVPGLGGYLRGERRDAMLVGAVRVGPAGGFEILERATLRPVFTPDAVVPDAVPLRGSPGVAGLRGAADRFRSASAVGSAAGAFDPRMRPSLEGSAVEMVIVTSEALVPEFERLAAWRTRAGVPTVVRTVEWIRDAYPEGTDVPARIRLFLRDAVNHWGTEAAILGGDSPIIPARYGRTTWYLGEDIPTDLYYQCLDGSWNGNGNSLFGEGRRDAFRPGDDVDLYPDLWIGRMSANNVEEARTMVDKVLRYETAPPVDDDYPASGLFLGEVLFPREWNGVQDITFDGAQLAEGVVALLPAAYPRTRLYENHVPFEGSIPETITTVIREINRGYGLVNHVGHGLYNNMAVGLGDRSIFIPDVNDFHNGDRTSFLYAINCTSAGFDYDSIAERWLTLPGGGAFACVGSTRYDFPVTSQDYDHEFFRLVFQAGVHRIGEAAGSAKIPYIALSTPDNAHRWTQFTLVYLGDPNLRLWTARPGTLTVTHDTSVAVGTAAIPVTVRSGGAPLAGALVTLYRAGETFARGVTDGSGVATLTVAARTAGDLLVTVTADNQLPYQGSMTVVVATAGVPVIADLVADPAAAAGANGNGLLEAGETAQVTLTLRNAGGAALAGIAVVASATGGDLTVGAATGPASLAAGTSGEWVFPVTAPADLPDLETHAIVFAVTATSGSWSLGDRLPVAAPRLEMDVLTTRLVSGSDNGVADPGDVYELTPSVANRGAGASRPLTAALTAFGSQSEILVGTSDYGVLAAGETGPPEAWVPLRIRIGADGPPRPLLTLLDASGARFTRTLDFTRPFGPGGIAAVGRASEIEVLWTPNTESDLMRYIVYRADDEAGPFTRISGLTEFPQAVYVDGPIPPLTAHYYRVAAVDSSGNVSPASVPVRGTTTLSLEAGFPVESAIGTGTSPIVTDLDGDGVLDVIAGGEQVYAFHGDGSELRDGDVDARTLGPWTNVATSEGFWASPAAADLSGDGRPDLVAISFVEGVLYAWDGAGHLLDGWPRSDVTPTGGSRALGAPTLADLDGDGALDVLVHTETALYAWNAAGEELRDGDANPLTDGVFYVTGSGDSYASVAADDLDGDGTTEVVIATRAGRLYVVEPDGTARPGFPIQFGHDSRPAPLVSSPALADLDGDGALEIVFGTGIDSLEVIRADGTRQPGWPQSVLMNQDIMSSPAVADVDGDGSLDVTVVSGNTTVYLWHADGTVFPGFGLRFTDALGGRLDARGSPVIANLDDDDDLEIVFGNQDGWIYAVNLDATLTDGFPIKTGAAIEGAMLVADIDGDGMNELVVAGFDRNYYVYQTLGPVTADRGWPMYQHDPRHTGSVRTSLDDGLAPVLRLAVLQAPELPDLASFYAVTTRRLAAAPALTLDGADVEVETVDRARGLYRAAVSLAPGSHVLGAEGATADGYSGSAERAFDAVSGSGAPGWRDAPASGARIRVPQSAPVATILVQRVAAPTGGLDGAPAGDGPVWSVGPAGLAAPAGLELELPVPSGGGEASIQRWEGTRWRSLASRAEGDRVRAGVDRFGWFRVVDGATPVAALGAVRAAPNPFLAEVEVAFTLDREAAVRAEIYDVRGARCRVLADARFAEGEHTLRWDGRGDDGRARAAGIYFVRVRAEGTEALRKIVRIDGGNAR